MAKFIHSLNGLNIRNVVRRKEECSLYFSKQSQSRLI